MTEQEEVIMCHRYRYYVLCRPTISDAEYDALEAEAMKTAAPNSPIRKPGSDSWKDYPQHIRMVA